MSSFKWLFLKHLRSKTLKQIQNLVPHRLMSRLKSKTTPGDTLRTRPYSCRRLDLKDGYRWLRADDENSDFVVNAAEQKVIKGTASNSRPGQVAPTWRNLAAPISTGQAIRSRLVVLELQTPQFYFAPGDTNVFPGPSNFIAASATAIISWRLRPVFPITRMPCSRHNIRRAVTLLSIAAAMEPSAWP